MPEPLIDFPFFSNDCATFSKEYDSNFAFFIVGASWM